MASMIIPTWNVTSFSLRGRDSDHYGPFASAEAAKTFVRTQVPEDAGLAWQPILPGGNSLSAQLPGERWRILKSQLVFSEGSAEFDAAVLRVAAEILKRRFGVLNCHNERLLLEAAATRIEPGAQSPV